MNDLATDEDSNAILAEAKAWQERQQELLKTLRARRGALETELAQVNAAIIEIVTTQRPHVISGSLSARIVEALRIGPAKSSEIRERLAETGGFRDATVVAVCLSRMRLKGVIIRGDDARWRLAANFGGVLTYRESVRS
ncbi:MAG: hypothetical protein ABFE07_11225 [Armatimonadia bacterium]